MDCNMRSPLQWDWENWIMFNPSQPETHKRQLSTEWGVEKDEGIESVVPCFSGFDGVSSGSGANFWHTALSKSSQSASVNSSPNEVKTCKLASEGIPEDSCSNIDFVQAKASPAFEVSVGSAESLLGLKLGKRTYFEDICGGNDNDISAVPMNLTSSVAHKKSKSSQSVQVPRCQVEGCDLDLSSAKDYHRKHRVCESHSKCPKVIVCGLERRFCQQCSRFHALSEFDEKKRSCRKRLSHHNARRRKPQQGMFPLNPTRIYDRRQQGGLIWNGLSLNTRSEEKFTWEATCGTKPTQTEGITLSFQKGNRIEEQLLTSNSQPLNSFTAFQGASGFSAGKSNIISFQVPGKGVGEFSVSPGGVNEAQDFHRALSLLSTTSYESSETKRVPVSRHTTSAPMPTLQPMSEAFPTLFI